MVQLLKKVALLLLPLLQDYKGEILNWHFEHKS